MNKDNKILFLKWIIIAIIVWASFYVRLINIEFGLPYFYQIDECSKIDSVEECLKGNFKATKFFHPTFLIYSTTSLIYFYEKITMKETLKWEKFLIGRFWMAFLGACTVFIIIIMGMKYFSFLSGVLSGIFLSLSLLHICCSHYIKEDIPLVFWITVGLFFIMGFIKNIKYNYLYVILSGLFLGFAASTKYIGFIISIIMFSLAIIIKYFGEFKKQKYIILRNIFVFTLIFFVFLIIGFIIFTPYSLFADEFREGLKTEIDHNKNGHETVKFSPWEYYWLFHFKNSLISGMSLPLLIFCLIGIIWAFKKGKSENIYIALCTIFIYMLIESSVLKPPPFFQRYILPVIMFLSLLGGIFAADLIIGRKSYKGKILLSCLIVLIFVPSIKNDFIFINSIKSDTRDEARRWLIKNAKRNTNVLAYYWAPYNILIEDYFVNIFYTRRFEYINSFDDFNKFDYVVISSLHYSRFYDLYPQKLENEFKNHYQYIMNNLKLIKEFKSDYPIYGFHNPIIKIYSGKDRNS